MRRNIIITGGSSGLGAEITNALFRMQPVGIEYHIINWSLDTGVDVSDAESVVRAVAALDGEPIYALINCAGVNLIDFIPNVTEADWDRVLDTNVKGIFLTVQGLLANLQDGGTVLNIVSNAAHVPMTNSSAYNASKGAALILTKQLARELGKTHGITVFSVSPNKLAGTGMSRYIEDRVPALRGWTPEQAAAYQLAALPAGEETDPAVLAEFIAFLLSDKSRHKYLTGCDIQYGA